MKKKIRRNKTDKDGYEYHFEGLDPRYLRRAKPPEWVPSPEEIAKTLKTAKITILLEDGTIEFFKKKASQNNIGYQKMIREVLGHYVQSQQSREKAA